MRAGLVSATTIILALGACQSTPGPAALPVERPSVSEADQAILVGDQASYWAAMAQVEPGDTIVLADGIWRDFDMLVDARGTQDAPVTVKAQSPGGVVLSGQSSLRLAGEHLVVSGLVFRDGYTSRAEVISFRRDSETLANNSRVTETVIENYSNPDRTQRDIWVVMYGRNNVFDHNHLAGKLNSGPTMAVRLNTEDSQNNNHQIAYNYFGPRPVFGSNGGETLRIGTSHYSLTRSGTRVEHNFFDRCSGEVEIVSNKSGGNAYVNNTFFQSRGTLTLRHGNDTLVEGNLFDGSGAPYTGGVRVINARQTVRNNFFTGLRGERFSGALVVMNGVPNSPINRYHQVDGARIEDNIFKDVRRIELAEGADAERSAVPVNSVFRGNIVLGETSDTPFNIQDDVSGIVFSDNQASIAPPDALATGFTIAGIDSFDPELFDTADYGVALSETGVPWHPKPPAASPFSGGERLVIEPGEDALTTALSDVKQGDTVVLAAGNYHESKLVNLRVPVTIEAEDPTDPPLIRFERPNLIVLSDDGAVRMQGLVVSGSQAPDASGNSFISTTKTGGSGNHIVELADMRFEQFDVNRGFSVISAAKGTFFDRIHIQNSAFEDVSGAVIKLDTETDDYGIYNAEYLHIEDSRFMRIGGPVASVYRGGRDESTFGPHVWVERSEFDGIGLRGGPLMRLHGVQNLKLVGNQVANANPAEFVITTGHPKTEFADNSLVATETTELVTTVDTRNQ